MVTVEGVVVVEVGIDHVVVFTVAVLAQLVLEKIGRAGAYDDAGFGRIFGHRGAHYLVLRVVAEAVVGVEGQPFVEFEDGIDRSRQPFVLVVGEGGTVAGHDVHAVGRLLCDDRVAEYPTAVGVVGHHKGQGVEGVVGNVASVFQTGSLVLRVVQVSGYGQVEPVFDVATDAGPQVGRVEVVGVLFVDTLLGVVVGTDEIVHLLGAARYAHVVVPGRTRVADEVVVPVEVGIVHVLVYTADVLHDGPGTVGILYLVVAAGFQLGIVFGRIFGVGGTVVGAEELVDQHGCIVSGGDEVGAYGRAREAEPSVVVDFGVAGFAFLGCDENDTERGAGTVDGGRRGIFQYRNRLDVARVDVVEITLDTVDEHQRLGLFVDRTETTDVDAGTFVGATRTVRDVQVGDSTLQGTAQGSYRPVFDLFRRNGVDGTGQVGLLLRTVTDYHHLVEGFGVFDQLDVDVAMTFYFDPLRQIPDVRVGNR